ALLQNGEYASEVRAGEEAQLILDVTPFYAESGGQIADHGYLLAEGVKVFVKDVQKAPNGQNLHQVVVEEGTLTADVKLTAVIDKQNRSGVVK
ncbi:alanine--tRNA ligase-related protein, partial [Shewanella sp. A3A]|nr:alanine--tRNA ligase-related protein [Shewanella ferrihydritica]